MKTKRKNRSIESIVEPIDLLRNEMMDHFEDLGMSVAEFKKLKVWLLKKARDWIGHVESMELSEWIPRESIYFYLEAELGRKFSLGRFLEVVSLEVNHPLEFLCDYVRCPCCEQEFVAQISVRKFTSGQAKTSHNLKRYAPSKQLGHENTLIHSDREY